MGLGMNEVLHCIGEGVKRVERLRMLDLESQPRSRGECVLCV